MSGLYRRLTDVRNPMHPWTWEAIYTDGRRLRQYGVDGYHRAAEIEGARVAALVIHGHPASPIRFVPPDNAWSGPVLRVEIEVDSVLALGVGPPRTACQAARLRYVCAAGVATMAVPVRGPAVLFWDPTPVPLQS